MMLDISDGAIRLSELAASPAPELEVGAYASREEFVQQAQTQYERWLCDVPPSEARAMGVASAVATAPPAAQATRRPLQMALRWRKGARYRARGARVVVLRLGCER